MTDLAIAPHVTQTTPDDHDGPQHLTALARANAVRLRQADLKRRVRAGDLRLDDLLSAHSPLDDDDADALGRMRVYDLLIAARRCGPTVARKTLSDVLIPEQKRIERMTARQRGALAQAVRQRIPWACSAPAREVTR